MSFLFIDARRNDRPITMFGHQFYYVMTGSMEPTIKTGGVVVVYENDFSEISVGDVIAFRSKAMSDQTALHRVVELTEEGAITKGDNNQNIDGGYVTRENYEGEIVFRTNLTASFLSELRRPGGVLRVVVTPALIIILVVMAYKFLTEGTDWRMRGLIISALVLILSGSILVSYHIYNNNRQETVNMKLGEAVDSMMDARGEVKSYLNEKEILGSIEIPRLGTRYPIIEYTKRASLDTSIALLDGAGLNEEGNTVLLGNSIYNNIFFNGIEALRPDDEIIITRADLTSETYLVNSSIMTDSTDRSVLAQPTHGKRLTLVASDYDLLDWYVVKASSTSPSH